MSLAVRQALFTKLSATSGVTDAVSTRIYHEQSPPDASYPLVVFSKASGTKTRAFQTPNAFNREVWMVKAVDRNTTSNTVDAIAAAIDAALDGGSISVSGKALADLTHVSDVEYLEQADDQTYRHSGSNFAVVLTAT